MGTEVDGSRVPVVSTANVAKDPVEGNQNEARLPKHDLMVDIRDRNRAWDSVKRKLANWAAKNEGGSMTEGDVTVSSSIKDSTGVAARPGYHYLTFKKGATTIELLVHDASGDIARDSMTVNGVKVQDFSRGIGDTLGKLKGMIDAMKVPLATQSTDLEKKSEKPQNARQKLIVHFNDDELMNKSFIPLVQNNTTENLAVIASNVLLESRLLEEKVLVLAIMSFARELSLSPKFKDSSARFSMLGPDVGAVTDNFNPLSSEQRKPHFNKWLNAMHEYLRVSNDGQIVIQDDNGKQYRIVENGDVTSPQKKLEGLRKIPENPNGRVAAFLAVRAMLGGRYNRKEILGFMGQEK